MYMHILQAKTNKQCLNLPLKVKLPLPLDKYSVHVTANHEAEFLEWGRHHQVRGRETVTNFNITLVYSEVSV